MIDDIINDINSGGITYDVIGKQNLGGQKLYSVSPYHELTTKIKGSKATLSNIADFLEQNIDYIVKSKHALGGWYNKKTDTLYLDISVVTPDKILAKDIGKKANQVAIFDLNKFKDIPTGGTGEVNGVLSTFEDRINFIDSLFRK